MAKVWTICGAGRRVGKTHLAERLCRVLPGSLYVKQGHGRARRTKCPRFFHSPQEARAFVEAEAGRHEHVVVESNALAREGFGDAIVFVGAPADRADVRADADALRRAADIVVAPGAHRRRWPHALSRLLNDAKLRRRVEDVMGQHATFLTACRLEAGTKVWLEAGGRHIFGRGLADLLGEIDGTGSLRRAAAAAGMSYRYAWKLIRQAESHLGRPLVEARPGGRGGGGSDLSLDGRRLLEVFCRLDADVAAFAAKRFARLQAGHGKGDADG